ncbi:hypothetical protein pdam_00010354 [Pocillopora damicornis]|uniref:Calponin-homology (CH) domain-containing protein n=1 Tax=Pocillopora damicornis TaxID=46731 RepID=A0A3M6UFE5_POCDA|nr:hypothetical protein pdam_00010354 [Pocillopora damicornis]
MALHRKLSGSPVEVYKAWVNCCLADVGDNRRVTDLADDLKDGVILSQLIKSTTGYELSQGQQIQARELPQSHQTVQLVIDYMKVKGIVICCQVEDRAAYQRTVNLGKRFLLEWCCTEIPNSAIDPRGPFLDFLQDGFLLTKLITKYCPVDGINISDLQVINKDAFVTVLETAEDCLGIPCKILSSSGILDANTFDEYAVIIYMAVLRRKVS